MSAPNNHQFDFENFQGFSPPYYTPVPDLLFDEIMQDLNAGELKTLLYIIRRTFGFKRSSDDISLAQMLNGITTKDGRRLDRGVGLSKPTLLKSLRTLKEKNLIEANRNRNDKQGDVATTYRLKMASGGGKETLPPRGKKSLPGGWSKNFTTQETVIQETEQHESEINLNNNNNNDDAKNPHDVVVALINKGISEKVAKRTAHRYSRKRIEEKIELLEWKLKLQAQGKARGRPIEDSAAWLLRAIEENYSAPEGYKSRAEREAEAVAAEKRRQALKEHEVQQEAVEEQKRQKAQKAREEKLKAVKAQYKTTPETEALWSSWLSHIRATDSTGAALLQSGCELLAVHDHEVMLWVDNTVFLKKVQRQYAKTIKQLAARHLKISFTEVELKPVIAAKNSEKDDL